MIKSLRLLTPASQYTRHENPAMNSCSNRSLLRTCYIIITLLGASLTPSLSGAEGTNEENWPMWRYDAGRSAASPNKLPDELRQLWRVDYGQRQPAWDDPLNLDLMTYDRTFEPIVIDGRMFIGFNDRDRLLALDASTGKELWSYYAEGPVRLRLSVTEAEFTFAATTVISTVLTLMTASLLEIQRGSECTARDRQPSDHIGLASSRRPSDPRWKSLFRGKHLAVYGTFIYSLDAATGEVEWRNDSTGAHTSSNA